MPGSNEVHTLKGSLREQHLHLRKHMGRVQARDLSWRVQERVLQLASFAEAGTVGVYTPLGNEVDTRRLRESASARGAEVAYPLVVQENIEFVRYSEDCTWRPGSFGILEPHIDNKRHAECVVAPEYFDVIVVPGVAFDRFGNRLGYGKGFYDRYLPQCKDHCVFIGLAYGFQLEEKLPCESHDIRLNYIVTDEETIRCRA